MGMRHSVFDSNLALHLILDGVGVIGDGTHGVDDGVQHGMQHFVHDGEWFVGAHMGNWVMADVLNFTQDSAPRRETAQPAERKMVANSAPSMLQPLCLAPNFLSGDES